MPEPAEAPAWTRTHNQDQEEALVGERGKGGAPSPVGPAEEASGPVRLLIVDDEPDVQRLFELRFRKDVRAGELELQFAGDGQRALEMIEQDPDLDVVVTDLNMPQMDGLALLSVLDEMGLSLKTIVLTAYGDMQTIRNAMMRGAFDFQVKPLDIEDLRTTITKAVDVVRELRAGQYAQRRAAALEERNRYVEDVFGKYVSDDIVARLLSSEHGPELQGERRTLTVLMADIRGYTRLTESLPPEDAMAALNGYLDAAARPILHHGGTINEILGDGLLVFFGAPIPDEDAAEHAVAAAIEVQQAMADLNARHRAQGLPELAVGIGIHTGEALVGTIGSSQRMKYAAVGRNVNLAARIEGNTIGGQIFVSEDTLRAVGGIAETTSSFDVRVKGLSEPLRVFEIRGLGGEYGLSLPGEKVEPRWLDEPHPVQLARIIDKRVEEEVEAELLAAGPQSARLRTGLVVSPLDDAVCMLDGEELYGKVSECDVVDGVCTLTLVYTSVSDRARELLEQRFAAAAAPQ
jgi:class 3 adenylate cyclase